MFLKKSESGFSLIEILIVIAIMATLATIVLMKASDDPQRAKEASLRQNLAILRTVIESYRVKFDRYPSKLDDLVDKGLVAELPKDPFLKEDQSFPSLNGEGGWVYSAANGEVHVNVLESEYKPLQELDKDGNPKSEKTKPYHQW